MRVGEIETPIIYIKGKRAHVMAMGALKPIGSAIKVAKRLKQECGTELIHFVDLDALNGKRVNYDVYDHLTFLMYVEVEVRPEPSMIKPLLEMNARVVVPLPSKIDLSQFAGHRRLLVGKMPPSYKGPVDGVFDIYLDGEAEATAKKLIKMGKRVLVNAAENKGVKGVFARIADPRL
ncbi:MAG: hypothetical protein QXH30_00385 [Candidatus Bilamarchaeaceae archaeon]